MEGAVVPVDVGHRPGEGKAIGLAAIQHDPCRGNQLWAERSLPNIRRSAETIPAGSAPATRGVTVVCAETGLAALTPEPADRAMTASAIIN